MIWYGSSQELCTHSKIRKQLDCSELNKLDWKLDLIISMLITGFCQNTDNKPQVWCSKFGKLNCHNFNMEKILFLCLGGYTAVLDGLQAYGSFQWSANKSAKFMLFSELKLVFERCNLLFAQTTIGGLRTIILFLLRLSLYFRNSSTRCPFPFFMIRFSG